MNDYREEPTDPKTVIEDEAIAWFVKMRGDVDHGMKADFDAWYTASPEHQRAYHWAEAHFGASAVVRESSKLETAWHHRPLHWLMAGAAAAAVLVLAFGMQVSRTVSIDNTSIASDDMAKPLVTAAREIRTWQLPDGSSVTLDADSRVEVAMTNKERRLRLRQGKARFSVARERRPFIVEAAVGAVTADQAVFDMAFDRSDRVTVNLIAGRANMRGLIQSAVYTVPDRPLQPGRPVFYPVDAFTPQADDAPADTRDWPDGWVEYRSITLRDLVAQANRYSDQPIVIDDPAVGNMSASGRFKLTDTDAFVSRIAEALDLSVKHRSDGIHLGRR
ncbi:MAG: FecR domain-containing protein [Pseudomonadota bacterium]|jgi:transmembrane sensor|uniref:FecR family protein n=1 Tax=unclassified Sphingomonas TaxID=196159 RepID=UPI00053E4ADD|nr:MULTISPECIES: FecR domain-containing protein [unclassified Sphingomonas]